MRRRVYELCLFAAAYFVDPTILLIIWLFELAWWYFGIDGRTAKSNGF
jgi:hypothetical protein